MYHVYRFLNKEGKVIYIGSTSRILTRIRDEHFSGKSHLSKECINEVSLVEHISFKNKEEALNNEKHYIKLYNPLYNSSFLEINNYEANKKWCFYCDISNGKITKLCNIGNTNENPHTLLTIPKDLKEQLEKMAKEQNRSFNNLVITALKALTK